MYWASKKPKRAAGKLQKPDLTLFNRVLEKKSRSRAPQPIEVYQRVCKEKLKPIVDREMEKIGAKTKSERMTVRRATASREWSSETVEVQGMVMAELERVKEEGPTHNQLTNLDDAYGPEDYNKSVTFIFVCHRGLSHLMQSERSPHCRRY